MLLLNCTTAFSGILASIIGSSSRNMRATRGCVRPLPSCHEDLRNEGFSSMARGAIRKRNVDIYSLGNSTSGHGRESLISQVFEMRDSLPWPEVLFAKGTLTYIH